jgi:hypothetical protein
LGSAKLLQDSAIDRPDRDPSSSAVDQLKLGHLLTQFLELFWRCTFSANEQGVNQLVDPNAELV